MVAPKIAKNMCHLSRPVVNTMSDLQIDADYIDHACFQLAFFSNN